MKKKRSIKIVCLVITVLMVLMVVPVWALGESEADVTHEIATELVYAAPFEHIRPGVYFDRETYSEEIVPLMNTTVRFWDDKGNVLREVQMWSGTQISPLLIPTPAIRHGVPGVPGQAFMGWFTVPNPSHYVNNPHRPQPFNLSQPIWSAGVFNLFGSWLQYGDVTGSGEVTVSDLLVLQRYIAGLPTNIIRATADVNVDGRVDPTDLLLLQQHLAMFPVTLGISNPASTVVFEFHGNGHTGGRVPQMLPILTPTTEGSVALPNQHTMNMTRDGHTFGGWEVMSCWPHDTPARGSVINQVYWPQGGSQNPIGGTLRLRARWIPNRTTLVLLPGIMGSRLYHPTTGRRVWDPTLSDVPISQAPGIISPWQR